MVSNVEIILRFLLASFLGGCVGLEREMHGRSAGVRTYLILSLGSAMIMIISEYIYFKYQGVVPGMFLSVDPGRIAAQAITGIGFLGAGVIIRYKDSIRGLTTAACVWVVCAVGLAIGAGFYLFGTVVTAITLFSLVVVKTFEKRLMKDWYEQMVVISEDLEGQLGRIEAILDKHNVKLVDYGLKRDLLNREVTANFLLRVRSVQPRREVLHEVFGLNGVKSVDLA
jgi:putative Mg2+ transporter-C (MgtC) family protein